MAYTTIDDPSAHFQIALYSGTGATQSITNDGNSDLQPDLVWIKQRSGTEDHLLFDSTRGTEQALKSNSTGAEFNYNSSMTAFNSDGFSLGTANGVNGTGTFVAWQWKANGGTTSSNTDGSLTSTVQANTDAGFSIVTYSNPSTSDNTIGHGLGVQPEVIIFKNTVDVIDWYVASKYLTNYTTAYLELNTTDAVATHADGMNSTAPTSSVFSVGGISRTGDNGNEVVAYCFASKQGYSKFGTYTGNNSSSGPFVYLGFKPAFMMIKRTDSTSNWLIIDNTRDPANDGISGSTGTNRLFPNLSNAEDTSEAYDLLSNGFKPRTTNALANTVNATYLYMAFAENPFVTSTGIPTTAR